MRRTFRLGAIIMLLILACASAASAQDDAKIPERPIVKSGEIPLYPHLARVAQIAGTVQVEVTTDGNAITKVSATGAHKLLQEAAEQNVRAWRFYSHKPQTFTVTFVYKVEGPEVFGDVNPTVLLELPNHVEVRTKMPRPDEATR